MHAHTHACTYTHRVYVCHIFLGLGVSVTPTKLTSEHGIYIRSNYVYI